MNVIAKVEQPKMMLLAYMADKYALNADEFSKTVRATCGLANAKPEEFAAFLIVAKEYNLNPLTKEIYAFPGRGSGIVPIVSIDGWVNLVNSHGACDGFEFDWDHDADGKLVSCTCRMYRKDRSKPVSITEYLSECIRPTDPWKMQHRMLRHKAMIQAARYAFGFSGIYDEDEGAKIAEMRDVTPREDPPSPPEPMQIVSQTQPETIKTVTIATAPAAAADPEAFVKFVETALLAAADGEALEAVWNAHVEPVRADLFPSDIDDLMSIYRKRETALNG
jgi:phage recombination protein Bet